MRAYSRDGTCIRKDLYFRIYRGCKLLEERLVTIQNRRGFIWRESELFCKDLVREWKEKLDAEALDMREFSVDFSEDRIEPLKGGGSVVSGFRDFTEDDT
jgi:hypothetical protein